ncbi:glutamate-gated chloride channel-like [Galendromus occidentalis]|uniref:Glutamate-gated chloride channel-like n=1 Tax=Galendromus occidentalis TaxID=34638 RepID=A0AAJ7SIR2_9ACAR|nr:glutamate-gated chloride channel-like [Galendromus occidentalis]
MRCCGVCLYVPVAFCLLATAAHNEEEKLFRTLLNSSTYDSEVRPPSRSKIMVRVNVFVRDVFYLDEIKRELGLQVTLRLRWKDQRLVFNASSNLNHLILSPSRSQNSPWVPRVFIMNEKEAPIHHTPPDNAVMRIYPNGQVHHSTRLSLRLTCPANPKYFPFGSAQCPLKISSNSLEIAEMLLSWDDGSPVFHKGIELDGYLLNNSSVKAEQCVATTKWGKYSCVTSIFHFTRMPRRWFLTFYLPCLGLMSCAVLAAILRKKNENVVNAFCFVACVGISLQVCNVPSSSRPRAIDFWILIVYGFFLLHTLVYSYPRTRKGNASNSRFGGETFIRSLMGVREVLVVYSGHIPD